MPTVETRAPHYNNHDRYRNSKANVSAVSSRPDTRSNCRRLRASNCSEPPGVCSGSSSRSCRCYIQDRDASDRRSSRKTLNAKISWDMIYPSVHSAIILFYGFHYLEFAYLFRLLAFKRVFANISKVAQY